MKVGLNGIFMSTAAGGVGTYLRELTGAFVREQPDLELTLFLSAAGVEVLSGEDWWGHVRHVRLPKGADSRWNLPEVQLALPLLALKERVDVLHSPANVGPIVAPRLTSVVTLHDLIWLHHPELVGMEPAARDRTRALMARSAKRADRLLAGAHAAADDLQQTFGIPAAKIDVVPHGVSRRHATPTPESELRERLGLGDRRVVLSVAQRQGYKRLDAVARATAALGRDDVAVVLAGASGPAEPDLRALAAELELGDRFVMPGWLSAEDLEGLYSLATAFVLASIIEGFGLPILEAMARGVPVACSNVSTLPEVAGDAAILFDPHDQAQVDAAVSRLVDDAAERARLIAAGRARAAEFTWERSAALTKATYEKALAS